MDIASIPCDMYVDVSATDCSLPDSKFSDAVNAMDAGKMLLAVSEKSSLQADVPACCRLMKLELVDQGEADGQYYYLIRKLT